MKIENSSIINRKQCAFRRAHSEIQTKGSLGNEQKKARCIKEIMISCAKDRIDSETTIQQMLIDSIEKNEIEFPITITRDHWCEDAVKIVKRYVEFAKTAPLFNFEPEEKIVDLFGYVETPVKPDVVLVNHNRGLIKVIKVFGGKPWVRKSETSRSYENSKDYVGDVPELYAMILYGKELVPVGASYRVDAEYHFAKKTTDAFGRTAGSKSYFSSDFADGDGGNIAGIETIVDKTSNPAGAPTAVDAHFLPIIEDWYQGETEDEAKACGHCDTCDAKNICSYKPTPPPVPEVEKEFHLDDIVWNDGQMDFIAIRDGLYRVNAVPGSGKTLCTIVNVCEIIAEGCDPSNIVIMTFTVAAANEARMRIEKILEEMGVDADLSDMYIGTYDSFANLIVCDHFEEIGFDEEPNLVDELDQAILMAEFLEKEEKIPGVDYANFNFASRYKKGAMPLMQTIFGVIKRKQLGKGDVDKLKAELDEHDMLHFCTGVNLADVLDLYERYDLLLHEKGLVEFADMMPMALNLLEAHPEYLDEMHIMHSRFDEFQDSDEWEIKLVKMIYDLADRKSTVVVGDVMQSIYGFRGCDVEIMENLEDYLNAPVKDIHIIENHRSSKKIISLANKIAERCGEVSHTDIVGTRDDGVDPLVKGFYYRKDEIQYHAEEIKKKIDSGVEAEKIAVIAPNKSFLDKVGTKLSEMGVPWVSLCPEPYIENSKVKAALSLAKVIKNPNDTTSAWDYLNVLFQNDLINRPDSEVNTLIAGLQAKAKSIQKLVDYVKLDEVLKCINALDPKEEDEVFASFKNSMSYHSSNWETGSGSKKSGLYNWLNAFELFGANLMYRRKAAVGQVVLTTAHSSKGLEWDIVFLSLTDFHTRAMGNFSDYGNTHYVRKQRKAIEERRRLFYVAETRARDEIIITGLYEAFGNKKNGKVYNQLLRETFIDLGKSSEYVPVDPDADLRKNIEAAANKAAALKRLQEEQRIKADLERRQREAVVETQQEELPVADPRALARAEIFGYSN